jgi:hypothetical protein
MLKYIHTWYRYMRMCTEFETLEPNEEDIAMFFEVPMDEMASDIVDLSDLNSTFDYTAGI